MPGPAITKATRSFAANVRRLRTGQELTQHELAERSGMEARSLRAIEGAQNSPSFASIVRLAWALEVGIEELFKPATHQRRGRGRPRKA